MKDILNIIIVIFVVIYVNGCTESSPLISDEDIVVVWDLFMQMNPLLILSLREHYHLTPILYQNFQLLMMLR